MMEPWNQKRPTWPKHLSYLPLSMGMIQPEWFYMNHFFDELAEENTQQPAGSSTSFPPSPTIQIHFRSRKK